MRIRFEFIIVLIALISLSVFWFGSTNDDSVGAASRIVPLSRQPVREQSVPVAAMPPAQQHTRVITPSTSLCGGLNNDGNVATSADSLVLSQLFSGLVSLYPSYAPCADVNGDRKIDTLDAQRIAQMSIGSAQGSCPKPCGSVSIPEYIPSKTICGDADGDKRVSSVDTLIVAKVSAGTAKLVPTYAECADTTGDGKIDVIDAQLISRIALGIEKGNCPSACRPLVVTAQCSDGKDNEDTGGDGLIDFPQERFGCRDSMDNDEYNRTIQCDDGVDNDGNRLIDYPRDSGCENPFDRTEQQQTGDLGLELRSTVIMTYATSSMLPLSTEITGNHICNVTSPTPMTKTKIISASTWMRGSRYSNEAAAFTGLIHCADGIQSNFRILTPLGAPYNTNPANDGIIY